jgi:hypothetical protein
MAALKSLGVSGLSLSPDEEEEPPEDSIRGLMVIPTSGMPARAVERLKIEIAKTMSGLHKN